MAFNWVNTYSAVEITKSMHGRAGMDVLYDFDVEGGAAQYEYIVALPTDFSIFRERTYNNLKVFGDGVSPAVYLFDNLLDNYQGVDVVWKLPSESSPNYNDFRYKQPVKWLGKILQGTAPNRTMTIRMEFDLVDQTFTIVYPNKVVEYTFYEAHDYVDAHMDAETEEDASFSFSYGDWADGVYFDDPKLATPLLNEFDYPVINRTVNSTDNKAYRLIMTDEWSDPTLVPSDYHIITLPDAAPANSDGMTLLEGFSHIDTGWASFTLDFPFRLGDSTWNDIYLSTEGYVTFGDGTDISAALSSTEPSLEKIFLFGGDRELVNAYTEYTGTAPNRTFRLRTESLSYPIAPPPPPSGLPYESDFIASTIVGAGSLTANTILLDVDDSFTQIDLPFDVNFNGATYNVIYIGTNGYLTFGGGSGNYLGLSSINPGLDKIFVYGGDRRGKEFYTGTFGTTPNRTFVIRLENIKNTGFGAADCSVEVTFYENNTGDINQIDINYDTIPIAFSPGIAAFYGANGYTYSSDYSGAVSSGSSLRFTPAPIVPPVEEWIYANTIAEIVIYENSIANTGFKNAFDIRYGINESLDGITGAYSNTGYQYITWPNIANGSYRIWAGTANTPSPPPPGPPPPGTPGLDEEPTNREPGAPPLGQEYFGRLLYYDKVWKGNANIELAITTADVGSHNAVSNNLTIINIQNASNNYLDFVPFYLGENVYTTDAGITFRYVNREFYIYLDTQVNGNNVPYGFKAGDTITQYCPPVTLDVTLTTDEYLSICGCASCGCTADSCGCVSGPSTAEDRTITVKLADAKTLVATVDRENTYPPYLVVSNTNGIFCGTTITSSGGITANIVGILAPILDRDPYNGNFIIERVAKYTDDFVDQCGNFIGATNKGQYLGPHIGIDRHFTNRRTMDHDDMFIIVSNWDITGRNVPMGRILDYWHNVDEEYIGIGMAANVAANVASVGTSKLMEIKYNKFYAGNSSADHIISVMDTGKLDINATPLVHHHMKIHNRCHDVIFFGQTVDVNTTLYTKSYSERWANAAYYDPGFKGESWAIANVGNAMIFYAEAPTGGGEFNWDIRRIKPEVNQPRSNMAYTTTVITQEVSRLGPPYDYPAGELWAGYIYSGLGLSVGQTSYPPNDVEYYYPRILSYLHTNTQAYPNQWYGFDNRFNFNSFSPNFFASGPNATYPWTNRYSYDLNVQFNWNNYAPYSIDGIDLRPRVWIEIPNVDDPYTNNIAGPGYTTVDQVIEIDPIKFPNFPDNGIYYTETNQSGLGIYDKTFTIPITTIIETANLRFGSTNNSGYQNNKIFNIDYNSTRIASSIAGNSTMTYVGNYTGNGNGQIQLTLPFAVNYGGTNSSNIFITTEEAWAYFVPRTVYPSSTFGYGNSLIQPFYNSAKYLNDLFYLESGVTPDRYFVIRAECGEFNDVTDSIYELTIFESDLGTSPRFEVQYENVSQVPFAPAPQAISANGDIANTITSTVSTVYWGANTGTAWRMTDSGNRTIETVPSTLGPYIDIHLGAYWQNPGSPGSTNKFRCNVAAGKLLDPVVPVHYLRFEDRLASNLATTNNGPNYFATVRVYLNYLNLSLEELL